MPGLTAASLSTFRRRAIATGVGAVAALTALLSLELWRAYERALAAAGRETINLSRALEEHTAKTLQAIDGTLLALRDFIELEERAIPLTAAALEAELNGHRDALPQAQAYLVIDARGRTRGSTLGFASRGLDVSDREYFTVHRDCADVGSYMSPPLHGRANDKWFIALSRRLNGPDGSFRGVVQVSIEPAYFAEVYQSIDVGPGGAVTLATREGHIVARHPDHARFVGRSIAGGPVHTLVQQADHGAYRGLTANLGTDRIGYFRAIAGTPLVINVGFSLDTVLAKWHQTLWIDVGIALIIVAAVALAVLFSIRSQERLLALAQADDARQTALRDRNNAELLARAKSAFLANMSHDLRTPLNAILGFSEMIRLGLAGPPGSLRHSEYGRLIENSARHLLDLVNDFLDLSAIDAGKLRLREAAFDLCPLAVECVGIVRGMAINSGVDVALQVPDSPLMVNADPLRLKQILLNLLSNAAKFTPSEGRISVVVARDADGASVAIQDTGVGMSPQDIRLALEPWQQVDSVTTRKFEGTGLGLPLTKALVELHGGHLVIRSAPQQGTEIIVRIPAERLVAAA